MVLKYKAFVVFLLYFGAFVDTVLTSNIEMKELCLTNIASLYDVLDFFPRRFCDFSEYSFA